MAMRLLQEWDKLHKPNVSIFHEMNCPLKFENKNKVCGGGETGGAEQHVCKVILVSSLSLSQAEQYKHGSKWGKNTNKYFL